jgi:hypothetical protein
MYEYIGGAKDPENAFCNLRCVWGQMSILQNPDGLKYQGVAINQRSPP